MISQKECRNACPSSTSSCHCRIPRSQLINACTNYTMCLATLYKFQEKGVYCQQFWARHSEGKYESKIKFKSMFNFIITTNQKHSGKIFFNFYNLSLLYFYFDKNNVLYVKPNQ